MPQGLITSLLIKLTFDFWYFSLLALILKAFIIRFTASDHIIKVLLIWVTGSVAFYCIACLSGIIFSSVGFYYTPFIMFILACLGELAFTSIMFRIEARKLMPSIVIANGLFFFLLFTQML